MRTPCDTTEKIESNCESLNRDFTYMMLFVGGIIVGILLTFLWMVTVNDN